jgi:hypothetical protein
MNTIQTQAINTTGSQNSISAEQSIAALLAVILGALSTYIVSVLAFQLVAYLAK